MGSMRDQDIFHLNFCGGLLTLVLVWNGLASRQRHRWDTLRTREVLALPLLLYELL